MAEAEGRGRVEEWQSSYVLDSGIQSGANTVRDDDGAEYTKQYTVTTTTTTTNMGDLTEGTTHHETRIQYNDIHIQSDAMEHTY